MVDEDRKKMLEAFRAITLKAKREERKKRLMRVPIASLPCAQALVRWQQEHRA